MRVVPSDLAVQFRHASPLIRVAGTGPAPHASEPASEPAAETARAVHRQLSGVVVAKKERER